MTITVKPVSATADLNELANEIHHIEIPGVRWAKQFKAEDVAYGLKELTVTAFLPPEVETDVVLDAVRELKSADGLHRRVSSADFVVFQKA